MCNKKYRNYCVGCGLCESEFGSKKYINNGFVCYDISNVNRDFLDNVCPISGKVQKNYKDSIWGHYKKIYSGYSTDESIRFKASSGGTITSLCIFLLESRMVDSIIQIRASKEDIFLTETVSNDKGIDVLKCVGSRYQNSSVLEKLNTIIDKKKKYAIVGRPCDISILKNYQEKYNKYTNILYTISFFCAGNPSDIANEKLMKAVGINDIKNCKSIIYRGNGWPGNYVALDKKGTEHSMKYIDSWGNYLGRSIRLMCKFCMDGCGSMADISCGDYWYLDNKKKPMFDENKGRNIIFSRTTIGDEILKKAYKGKYINLTELDIDSIDLKNIQPGQYERTTTLISKYLAFKLFFRATPKYNVFRLINLSKEISIRRKFSFFLGSLKRIVTKKM